MLEGLKNLLTFLNNNWALIITIIGLGVGLYVKVKNYLKLSKEQKVDLALKNAAVIMLDLTMKAEDLYGSKTGQAKRSQVISELYAKFPVLAEVIDQKTLLEKVDVMIDDALEKMKKILQSKAEGETISYNSATMTGGSINITTDTVIAGATKTE